MAVRTDWHCLACNRYFQTLADTATSDRCGYCGQADQLRRIDHPGRQGPAVERGATAACDLVGEVEEDVVGDVVAIRDGRVLVRAHDGTGIHSIPPDRIVPTEPP